MSADNRPCPPAGDSAVITAAAANVLRGPRALYRCPRCWELYWVSRTRREDTPEYHVWHTVCVGNAQPCIIRIGAAPVCTRYTCWGQDAPTLEKVDLEPTA